MTERSSPSGWLLVPAPPLVLAYLLAIRSSAAPPLFWPVVAMGVLPAWVLFSCIARARHRSGRARVTFGALAVLEIAWCIVAASAVGMAIGLRSG